MTLTYKLDLKILKMYLHIKNKLSSLKLSKGRTLQTDATENITTPHMRVG